MVPTSSQVDPSYTQSSPVARSITPFPATALGNALFRVVCGSLGGSTFTSATDPMIVIEVPWSPFDPVKPMSP